MTDFISQAAGDPDIYTSLENIGILSAGCRVVANRSVGREATRWRGMECRSVQAKPLATEADGKMIFTG